MGASRGRIAAGLKACLDRAVLSTAIGIQVVIDDYVHSRVKIRALIAMHLGCFAVAVAGTFATLRIAFVG